MADLKYYDVILKPVVTEKSMSGMGDKKYTFLVNPDATKNQIKDAVEKIASFFIRRRKNRYGYVSYDCIFFPNTVCYHLIRKKQARAVKPPEEDP